MSQRANDFDPENRQRDRYAPGAVAGRIGDDAVPDPLIVDQGLRDASSGQAVDAASGKYPPVDIDLDLEGDGAAPSDTNLDVETVRAQIEQTRAEMSGTIDALTEKLNPQRLADQARDTVQDAVHERLDQAKDTVRQATIGKVEDAVSTATEKVQDVVSSAGEALGTVTQKVQGAVVPAANSSIDTAQAAGTNVASSGRSLLDTIKQHPLPAALAGIGLGWLYLSARKDTPSTGNSYRQSGVLRTPYATGGDMSYQGTDRDSGSGVSQALTAVPDKAGQLAGKARDSATQLGSQVQGKAQQAGGGLQQVLQENPLAVGAVVAGVGMLVGLAVPETDKENQLLGQAHDNVMDKAGHVVMDTAQKVQTVAQEAVTAGKQAARDQDLLPES